MKEQAYGGIGSPSVDVPCKVQGLAVKALPSVQALISRSASQLMPRAPQDRRFCSIRWQMILIGSKLVAALQNVEALFERAELGPLTAFRATPMQAPALVLPRLLAITTHPQHRRELANTALIGFDHMREDNIRHACDLQNSPMVAIGTSLGPHPFKPLLRSARVIVTPRCAEAPFLADLVTMRGIVNSTELLSLRTNYYNYQCLAEVTSAMVGVAPG